MKNEKLIYVISTIERALGKIEGVAYLLDSQYSNPLIDALTEIDMAIKEITDGK